MIVFIFSFMFTELDNCKSGLCKIDTGQRNTAIHETQRTAAPALRTNTGTVSMSHDKQDHLQN